jgi:hypothetical protein
MRWPCVGIWCCSLIVFLGTVPSVWSQTEVAGLPRYDLQIVLDVNGLVNAHQVVTWTNRSEVPTGQIVFNAHAHYSIPDKDIGFLAKTVEILRMAPKEALNFGGPVLQMKQVRYRSRLPTDRAKPTLGPPTARPLESQHSISGPMEATSIQGNPVAFRFPDDNLTALIVALPEEVRPGESITLELDYVMKLPPKKGRWGQWDGITTLAQWIPVVAVFNAQKGWQPTPFIPWHQPFFNEAGHYTVQVRLPSDQKLAASATVRQERDLGNGWKEVVFDPVCVRDFALIASASFQEWTDEVDGVKIRCLARAEHEFYAKTFIAAAREALPVYSKWFGKYPYPQFTIVESCFGWNGNECGALVMIDDRMFNMPHIAKNYPVCLLQHELCHQWWYNVVGTNGYAETWMDEGLATYFSHRLADRTQGRNNEFLDYPKSLCWLPNIHRDDFRNYSMVGTWARGEGKPCVQDMPQFGHLVNLTSATYDRGSKVVGMIEDRLGEEAFLIFMRRVYSKYQFRILRVADFRHELEIYTGSSWEEFFQYWLYGSGQCDWAVERVEIEGRKPSIVRVHAGRNDPVRVVVHLRQHGDFNEPTTLGIRLQTGSEYQIRLPIHPDAPVLQLEEWNALIECTTQEKNKKATACVKVTIVLPCEPLQITVDPDHLLLDSRPTNNHWKQEIRWHLTPLYTQLDEIDVSNAHDRWNVNVGPWMYFSSYSDPWYTKSDIAGFRAGIYRTQELDAGAYVGYRTNDRNIVAGIDALWDHVPLPNTQIGLNIERPLLAVDNGTSAGSRGVIFGRYILMYGSSLYLPPFEYVEAFSMMQDHPLPDLREKAIDTDPYHERPSVGIHYHKNLMTPYWDAEGGYSLDLTYQYGLPIFGNDHAFHEAYGQFALVKGMPKLFDGIADGPVVRWLYDTRFAFRVGGAAGLPGRGLLFPLGGGDNFRGFDLSERQGSMLWLGSVEWRLPLAANMHADFGDHLVGVRNVYLAPFYDVGNAYVRGKELGPTAQAVGIGMRVDVTWLGLIERTMLRLDVAKTLDSNVPVQIWFGIQHPF